MRGGYVLLIHVPEETELFLKSIGTILLEPGIWAYVGSAMGNGSTNLENRINRHFRKKKKIHWHIDYLLASDVQLTTAIWAESQTPIECVIAQHLEHDRGFSAGPRKFGSSDCKQGCVTHLYYAKDTARAEEAIISIFRTLKLDPRITHDGMIAKST